MQLARIVAVIAIANVLPPVAEAAMIRGSATLHFEVKNFANVIPPNKTLRRTA